MSDKNPYLKTELKYFLHTFKRQPLLIARGKGPYVWDEKGRKYFDFYSGLAVCGVGHTNVNVVTAIERQSRLLLHSSNFFYTKPQIEMAKALTSRWNGSRVFFSNSGAEANELAIKLARLWATRHNKPGRDIISFHNSFHGRTLATTTASGGLSRATNSVFRPLPAGFLSVPFNNLERVKKAITKKTIALLVEPVQGEGGINVASPSFFRGLASLCRTHNILLIVDEIQSGLGRTGTFFAFEQYGLKPDIVTLAKGLAGGMPLAATLAQDSVAKHMTPGLHGSTFGGNPVACAAALEVLKMLTPKALSSIQHLGDFLQQRLSSLLRYPSVQSIRSRGLMFGVQLDRPGAPYVTLARKKGLLINCTHETVLRFLPPYFLTKKEAEKCLAILTEVFEKLR
jgi:acetylornithine/N-succinyldiaminopimelate aminotransferase